MSEHTPTPWKIDGVYIVAPLGPTIADCKKSPSMEIGTARLNAAFIVKAVNSHDALVAALKEAISQLIPFAEDGDQPAISAAIDAGRAALASIEVPS